MAPRYIGLPGDDRAAESLPKVGQGAGPGPGDPSLECAGMAMTGRLLHRISPPTPVGARDDPPWAASAPVSAGLAPSGFR